MTNNDKLIIFRASCRYAVAFLLLLAVLVLIFAAFPESYSEARQVSTIAFYSAEVLLFSLFGAIIIFYLAQIRRNSAKENIYRLLCLVLGSLFTTVIVMVMYGYNKENAVFLSWSNEFYSEEFTANKALK